MLYSGATCLLLDSGGQRVTCWHCPC